MNSLKHCIGFNLNTLVVAMILVTCGPRAFAISQGDLIQPNDAISDSLVNIKMQNGMCTGTLVSTHVVLAAAHCKDRSGKVEVVAKIGEGTTEPCSISTVKDTAFISGAIRNLPFRVHNPDLLLVLLNTPLCHTKPAKLSFMSLSPGDIVFAAGFGEGSPIFGQASKFEMQIIENKLAPHTISPMSQIAQDLLDAGIKTMQFALPLRNGTSVCEGDSGGPIYREYDGAAHIFGVSSATLPNQVLAPGVCNNSYLQIFTPLAPYARAIQTKIKRWN